MKQHTPEVKTPLQQAADAVRDAIDQIETDPKKLIARSLKWCAELPYPNEQRMQQACGAIKGIEKPAAEFVTTGSIRALRQLLGKLEQDCSILSRPIPVPSFGELLPGHARALGEHGWHPAEIDDLARYADGGPTGTDRIASADCNGVTFASGRTVTRGEIRDGLRPSWQPVDEYREGSFYQELQRAHAAAIAAGQQRAAASIVRVSSGPARLIGRPAA